MEPEGLLQRFFDATFPAKGGQGGRFYRVRLCFCVILCITIPPLPDPPTTPHTKQLYWWVLKAYGTSFRPVPPQRLTEYYQERMAHIGRLAGGDEGAGQV